MGVRDGSPLSQRKRFAWWFVLLLSVYGTPSLTPGPLSLPKWEGEGLTEVVAVTLLGG